MAIVTLLSDFGASDVYVGVMKARVLAAHPEARLVDLTHQVPPQDVRAGAFQLVQAARWFPRGTVHLAVVDPGVGTARRAIAIEGEQAFFVGPDNGLLTAAAGRIKRAVVLPIPKGASHTFHGRDVFAPVAGRLSSGAPLASLGAPAGRLAKSKWPAPKRGRGEIVHVDHFGNLITNFTSLDGELVAGTFRARKLRRAYGDVAPGEPLALIGSHGFVEIAVRDGSAANLLGLQRGAALSVRR
jgi:S-adenosyl-L-methionine hydrolase (adenosine-forming)